MEGVFYLSAISRRDRRIDTGRTPVEPLIARALEAPTQRFESNGVGGSNASISTAPAGGGRIAVSPAPSAPRGAL
jgi:hypothetical protein